MSIYDLREMNDSTSELVNLYFPALLSNLLIKASQAT